MGYMKLGLVCNNGGQGGAFNASWEKWQESLGIGPSVGLAFHISLLLLSALAWGKENDFDAFREM